MKKLNQKFLTVLLGLMMVGTASAVNWGDFNFLGDGAGGGKYDNMYKVEKTSCIQEVVNIQKPGFAAENGIYIVFPEAVSSCSHECAIQGGGICLYIAQFTAQETEVTVTLVNSGDCVFHVFYADGTTGGGGGEEPTPKQANYCQQTIESNDKSASIQLTCTSSAQGSYQIIIEGENLNGLGGSFYDPGATDLRNNITSSTSTKIVIDIEAASAPNIYTPLYVLMPGEKTFAWPNDIVWGVCAGTPVLIPSDLTITSSTELELEASATSQIFHTTSSTGAVTYSSSNEGVATVSASGLITAHKGGKATITVAQAADDTYAAGSKKITVTVPRTSQCSGDVGHYASPDNKRIHYELEYKDGTLEYTVTGLNSHAVDFLEVQTTKGNYAATLTNGIGTYKQTGLTEGEEIGVRFLYSTDEIEGNEMNSQNVDLDDPNIIYYKVGDCGAADPGLLTSDLTLISEAEVEIAINATSQISCTTTSTGAVTYSSSKESVATVSASGLITAIKGGKATITVSQAADATYNAGSLTVEVTVPEVITETTWWGTGSDQGVSVLYSITRNLNKTLTFHVDAWGDVTGIATPQINIKDVYNNVDGDGNYTTTATYETDEVVNLFFYIPFTGAAARIDVAYTVGSENVKPAIEVTGVSIDPASAAVEVGKTTSLTAIIKPAFATNTNISWSVTAGSEYASVDANGVVTGLAAGAATVQVTTESGSKTATCDVNVVAQILLEPNAAPAAPTYPANQVKAVYSATYSADCNFGEWGGGSGNEKQTYGWKFFSNNYFGLVDFTHNCSQMEKLHLDVWAATNITFRVVPIWTSTANQGVTVNIEGQKWNSIDLSLSEGAYAEVTDWSNVYQIKIDQAANETFWLNNVYFYTTQEKTTCALSASVKNNEGGTASVSIAEVAKGGTATFTAEAACGYSFVGWWNNTTKVSENTTYAPTDIQEDLSLVAEFSFVGPAEAATVPSYDLMIPIYNEGAAEGVNMFASWGQRTSQEEVTIAGHKVMKYGNINYQGIGFENNKRDVRAMKYVHLDIWSNKEGDIRFHPINDATDLIFVLLHLDECQWNSFDIALSEFGNDFDLTTIRQLKFDAQPAIGEGAIDGATILVQDIFFYAPNEFTLSEKDDNAENLTTFNGKVCSVTIGRTFKADGANYTLCLPFAMTEEQCLAAFGEGYKLWAMGKAYMKTTDVMYLPFSEVTAIEAGKPYLFCPAADVKYPTIEGVTINAAAPVAWGEGCATMTGIYSSVTVAESNYVLGPDNWLYQSADDKMLGLRCYFTLTPPAATSGVSARAIFNRSDVVTDFEPIDGAQCTMHDGKYIIDGRFVILRNNVRYNAVGEPVNR